MSLCLTAQPLSKAAFAPFGDVISTDGAPTSINQGQTQCYGDLAALDLVAERGRPQLSIFHTIPLPLPLSLRQMERHKLGSQMFFPLSNRPWLVVVAPKGDFEPQQVQAFVCSGRQGVNFHAGTWHHFSLALVEPARFLVLDRKADSLDCDEVVLNPPLQVTVSNP